MNQEAFIINNSQSVLKQTNFVRYEGVEKKGAEVCKYDYIHVPDNIGTIVAIGGVGGGFDGPTHLYDFLAQHVVDYRLSLLRIHVTPPHEKGAKQLLLGLNILKKHNNLKPLMLMGWSMGCASVIIAAKALIKSNDELKVKSIMTFAGQTAGAKAISEIDTKIHILHGDHDDCLDVFCAYTLRKWSRNTGEFIIFKGAGHCFEESREELREKVSKIIMNDFNISRLSNKN